MAKERTNIYEIAQAAGVSPATVSRVMTNSARVSDEKRQKVEEAIRRYGYRPNALAQGLSASRRRTIGLLVADVASPFYANVTAACEREADRQGYTLLIMSPFGDDALGRRQMLRLYEQNVDAMVIIGGSIDSTNVDEEFVQQLNHICGIMPIIASGHPTGALSRKVGLDESGSIGLAMQFLLRLGHTKIALIGGRKEANATLEKRIRYRAELADHGIAWRNDYVFETHGYGNSDGYQAMKQLLQNPDRPTAVIAINDATATGILRAAIEAGLRIPQDLSLVSFDNTFLAEIVTPQITSVGCDYEQYGTTLIATAIRAAEGKPVPDYQTIPVYMTDRGSCAAPAEREENRPAAGGRS